MPILCLPPPLISENIGNRATPQYFQNVKGGNKNTEKVQTRRTRKSRKILFISLIAISAILIVTMIIFVAINLGHKNGSPYTSEDFPESVEELKAKAFDMVWKEQYSFAEVGEYVRWAVDDTDDEERKFELNLFHAQLMYLGGYKNAAIAEIEYLEKYAITDEQKYDYYNMATFIYYYTGNQSLAKQYREKADALDVPENHGNWVGGTPDGEEEGEWAGDE